MKRFWKDFWYDQVSTRLFPKQKWLTDKIPRAWRDADSLIETCLFEILINFWENDEGRETLKFQHECVYGTEYGMTEDESVRRQTEYKLIYDRMEDAYDWAKNRQSYIDKNLSMKDLDRYLESEAERIDNDTFYMTEIVQLRDKMWS